MVFISMVYKHYIKYCKECAKEVKKDQWKQASYNYYHKTDNLN